MDRDPSETDIKAVIYGVGEIGGRIVKHLLKRRSINVVGAIDSSPRKVGRDLGDVIGLDKTLGITVSDDPESVLYKAKPDIVIITTSSFLKDVYPQVLLSVKNRANVISTSEELAYPYIVDSDIAKRLDEEAKNNGVTILGTGINPGFLMDTLPITLTTVCLEIEEIEIRRVMNASVRRVPFQKKIGAGLSLDEFHLKIEKGIITGHVGLEQSIAMIADALKLKLDRIETEPVKPVIAESYVESDAIKVLPGMVAGIRQRAYGIIGGKRMITLDFQAYIGAKEEYDSISIKGKPEVYQKISPCVHGDLGTVAVIINMIPKVVMASPGLKTMKDMLLPSAVLS